MINADSLPWWKKTVVYQIYPRSFMDSNGDGIGDLKGIISKLDYIKELGVETIWFSPFYASPQMDMGYDISDYQGIAPEYGNMDICDILIEEIHKRGMKVVFDMVMNHTSDKHPWFLESKSSKDNPKRDWYIWRDGKKPHGKAPPNKWRAMITGSGWKYDKTTDQWYWHQFLDFQPDLNYRNPELKAKMFEIVRFWLQKKVDGFRLDIINSIYEDEQLRENPWIWRLIPSMENPSDSLFRSSKYTLNLPDTFTFTKELRKVIDEFNNPARFLVGEVTGSSKLIKQFCGEKADGLNLVFLFNSLGAPLKAKSFRNLMEDYETNFPEPYMPTWVFGNHDRFRRISRLNNSMEKMKLNAALQMTARGVPFVYYGEEIGMVNQNIPMKKSQDAVAWGFAWVPQFILNIAKKVIGETLNRDDVRTPMQWDASPSGGFTSAEKAWLPLSDYHTERNVESENKDANSLLACYKRLLAVRKLIPALNCGDFALIAQDPAAPDVVAYKRMCNTQGKPQEVTVYLNFSEKAQKITLAQKDVKFLFSTNIDNPKIQDGKLELRPLEGIVIQ